MRLGLPSAFVAAGLLALPVLAGLAGQAPQDGAKVGAKIPAFTASAVASIDSQDAKQPTCYVIVGVHCGATPRYEKRLKALETEYRARGVDFVYVFPNKTETKQEKLDWMKKAGLRGPMIDDEGAKITKALECDRTAQAILVDKDGTILFRGGFDDNADESAVKRRHLAEALNEHLAGKPVTTTSAKAFG